MPRPAKPYEKDGWYCTSIGGKPHQKLCPVGEGLHKANEELAQLQAEIIKARRGGGHTAVAALLSPPPAVTVAKALDEFLSYKEANTRDGTYRWYVDKLGAFRGRYHDRAVSSLTEREASEYKTWLRHEKTWRLGNGPVRRGLSPTTVNQHLRAARAFFAWCHKPSRRRALGLGADAVSPFAEVTMLEEKVRKRVVTDEEMAVLLDNCQDGGVKGGAEDLREQLLMLRHTAMRPQELRHLRWEHVDWKNHRAVFPPDLVKTGRVRDVPLTDPALEILRARKARLEGLGLALTRRHVFALAGKVGKHRVAGAGDSIRTGEGLAKRFKNLVLSCAKQGLLQDEKDGERLVLYHLRHTRGTEMFVERNEQYVVQQAMGHATPMMTERYKHLAGSWVSEQVRLREAAARDEKQKANGKPKPKAKRKPRGVA